MPEVPFIICNRKLMKVGNRPIASAYLEHACTGIPIRDFSSLHFLRSERVRRAQSSFKRVSRVPWRCLECQHILVPSLQQEVLKIWDVRTQCSPKQLRSKREGLALAGCHLPPPPPSNRYHQVPGSRVPLPALPQGCLKGFMPQSTSYLLSVPVTIL